MRSLLIAWLVTLASGAFAAELDAVRPPAEFAGVIVSLGEVNTLRAATGLPALALPEARALAAAGDMDLSAAKAQAAAAFLAAPPSALRGVAAIPAERAALARYATATLEGRRPPEAELSELFDGRAGFFGPDSVMWRVNGHQAVFATGLRAYTMQIAHPKFAAATRVEASRLLAKPVPRLAKTLSLMRVVMFGDLASATKAAAAINRRHAEVEGTLPEAVGMFKAGEPFTATDPELLKWAWAPLFETSLKAYERYVGPLTEEEKDRYYGEYRLFGRLMSIPAIVMPETRAGLDVYMREMLSGDALAVGAAGREAFRALSEPRALADRPVLRALVGLAMRPTMTFTAGLLPERVRSLFGVRWDAPRRAAFRVLDAAGRLVSRALGRGMYGADWRRALRRVGRG